MEITTISFVFWFAIILLILSSLKSARKQFIINLMAGVSFIVLGGSLITPITYVQPFSISDYYYVMDEPHIPPMQHTAGWMFMLFGVALIINTLFQVLFGKDEDEGYGSLFEKGVVGK